jgi:hypothetical protein
MAGLPQADRTRILAVIAANHAPTTLTIYAYAWRQWTAWCAGRDLVPLPASPAAVCAYLTERAEHGAAFATLEIACAAISHEHRRHQADIPVLHEMVRQVRRGLRRTLGMAPGRQARALSVADIRRILGAVDRTTSRGARDAALFLLGFASALRRSEPAALTLADLKAKAAGLLTVRRSKTDPDCRGQVVGVAHGQHPTPTPSTPSHPGSPSAAPRRARCSPACAAAAARARSPAARSSGSSSLAPRPPACPACGSADTRYAPGTSSASHRRQRRPDRRPDPTPPHRRGPEGFDRADVVLHEASRGELPSPSSCLTR